MKRIIAIFLMIAAAQVAWGSETNVTLSPDESREAFTDGGNLYVRTLSDSTVVRLTTDGTDLIMNGYASWVYYEEIFGRSTDYKAFWWSPDGKKIAFYRFDDTLVPEFPIYSPFGQDGSLRRTRYPKAGENNPCVRIGIVDLDNPGQITWAAFEYGSDFYYGTPFWSGDSRSLYVQRMPRVQDNLDLFCVSADDGSMQKVYHEEYPTWINWIDGMLFGKKGLYMVRDFETGWEQIYYLSYDGKTFKRLTDGHNWRTGLVAVNEKTGTVYFTANRDSDVRAGLYSVRKKTVKTLSDTTMNVSDVRISEDFTRFEARFSNANKPEFQARAYLSKPLKLERMKANVRPGQGGDKTILPKSFVRMEREGLVIPAVVTYPENFDPSNKYPVIIEIYGGPNTAYVKDSWRAPRPMEKWCYENGIIKVKADCRVSGHNGRAGVDLAFKDVVSVAVDDFRAWAEYFGNLPYVDADRIGLEGFSFGGTMTAMLVMTSPDLFRCGVAGGGVYDWALYDSHYTERFMLTPELNPEGYAKCRVIDCVDQYDPGRSFLKLTHGTGDDNVHFQNTLQLIGALQRAGKLFELMIYPDGMHGYRGVQGEHDNECDKDFWTRKLLN